MCMWVGNMIDNVRVSRQLRRRTAAISGRLNEGPSGVDQVQRPQNRCDFFTQTGAYIEVMYSIVLLQFVEK